MSEHPEDVGAVVEEVAEEKTEEKVQHHEPPPPVAVTERSAPLEEVKNKINRMFGREKPVHHCLGGGKPADILLWKNKKMSAGIVGGVTLFWVLFECFGYHLITLVCHCLMLGLGILFIWSTATTFINKTPPNIPEIVIPEDVVVKVAVALRYEINRGFAILREIASGKDLKKFLTVIVGLWVLSVVGSWCNFLTLFYIAFLGLHTLPVLYDKYEDEVDALAEKATIEIKKQYAVFEAQVLSKIPKGPLKDKKH